MARPPVPEAARWADPETRAIQALLAESGRIGWRAALDEVAARAPTFARRMRNLGLGNWHLLLAEARSGAALDVGSGFGSLPLGLGRYFRQAIGAEMLPERVAFAGLRAREERCQGCRFVRASGFALPFQAGRFDLVTFNGVLEWAGLYAAGNPRARQLDMLREARRVLAPDGHVAVAIENRLALESLLGMRDTHTGVTGSGVVPRWVAGVLTRLRTGTPFRTYLYHQAGYRRLFREAGFGSVRLLDLMPSYNDYDFVLDPLDGASYRLLAIRGLQRAFHGPSGRVRQALARRRPATLGALAYAYLVVGGRATRTLLDAAHPFWEAAAHAGVSSEGFRFACQGREPGQLALVVHDGESVRALVELGVNLTDAAPPVISERLRARLAGPLQPGAHFRWNGLGCRVWQPLAELPRRLRGRGPAAGAPLCGGGGGA